MNTERISVFTPPISSAYVPVETLSLEDIWERVRTDSSLKENTRRLRSLLQEGRGDEYKELKKDTLPAVTFGGVFDYRCSRITTKLQEINQERIREGLSPYKGLLYSSNLVIIDIDHVSGLGLSLQDLREKLANDGESGVRMIFISPSGDGLKVVCKVSGEIKDDESYKVAYNSLLHHLEKKYSLPVGREGLDKSGKDISRLCLLCHDSEAILIDDEEEFNVALHPAPKREREFIPSYTSYGEDDGIEEIVRRVEESGVDIAPTYDDYLKLAYSFTSLGERGREYFHRVCRVNNTYKPEEADKQFNNCLSSGQSQSIGTFVNMVKDNGIDVSNPVEHPERKLERPNTRKEEDPVDSRNTEAPESQDGKWGKYLHIPSLSEVSSVKRGGIETDYRFSTGGAKPKEEALTLRSGALTLICGKSSHCKSKFLQNLSLQIANDNFNHEDEVVLFFSYEEELSEVLAQFANIHSDTPGISRVDYSNTEAIIEYFKTRSLPMCDQATISKVTPKLEEFESLYNSGGLRVFYSDLSSEDLCELVRYYSSQIKVKAVFVDYIQLLYMSSERKKERRINDRREEIKEICNELRTLAIDLSIPVVSSAQLNRETPNPTDMSEDNIADSADITRYANTIVCLWNSSFSNVKGGKESYIESPDYKTIKAKGFTLGEGGKIYARITKNRGGTPYTDTVLDFRGETGKIYSNNDLPEEIHTGVRNL